MLGFGKLEQACSLFPYSFYLHFRFLDFQHFFGIHLHVFDVVRWARSGNWSVSGKQNENTLCFLILAAKGLDFCHFLSMIHSVP